MSRFDIGGVINWSAFIVAQFITDMTGVYVVVAMCIIGAGLMVSAALKERKRKRP